MTMDPATAKRWEDWAEGIAKRVYRRMFGTPEEFKNEIVNTLRRVLGPLFKEHDGHKDRIAELERRIAELEKATTGDNGTEWPIPERKVA